MRVSGGAKRASIVIVSIGAVMMQGANAETLTYGVDAGVGETDNVTLTPTDKISQTIATVDGDFAYKQQSRRLDLDAKGNFTYLDYLQNAYGRQFLGRFDGLGQFAIVPERFEWVLQDDFGEAALDPFTPVTPTNLEKINYVSTGPDLSLRLGGTSFIKASARYARTEYETSPFDSNRLLGNLAWGLDLSARSDVSLNADTEHVKFENTIVNTDFDRTNAYVQYELRGARSQLSAELGATTISQGGTSTRGGLGKLQLTRTLSAAGKITLTAGRILTDGATSFSNLQGGALGVVGAAPATQTSDNYTSDYASVGWQFARNRTTVDVSGRWEKDSYAGLSTLDYTRGGGEFKVERKLTRAFSAEVLGRVYKYDYPNAIVSAAVGSPDYSDTAIGAALAWRGGRSLEVIFRVDHDSRVTTGPNLGYSENRAFLTVGYRPRPAEAIPEGPADVIN
jgi:hypothetical protein